ncbi:serine hydrolase domain-containing protein [Mucilaginibacter aquaedulcis]|uniref:serine hydrolase domain-containing protein n=1 Tax=Mucilaginibacter aquaedulcis TaxID=1187081 RepID=UPI0025B57A88|nr:serine hydrolase domain-containing protein [Mucilaginibacter aquaedulcis]MDN3547456.1 serine hydrolase domain-containing protein [Mucilaginibacter aquaedulcis]
MKKMYLVFSILFVCSFGANAQDTVKTMEDMNDSVKVAAWIKQKHIPALGLAYADNGKLQTLKVYGELKPGISADNNAIFNVASLTKPITTMVTLNLINAGLWQLDEPLFKYWTDPDIAADPRSHKLTTRDILTHRSGFPNWRSQLKDGKLAFQADPGTKYGYSGEGFEYLRHALEHKFHRSLAQLADSIIFKPLRMNDTHFTWDNSMETRFAYPTDGTGKLLEITKNTEANAADLLKTTIGDYSKFLMWLMKGGGVSKQLYSTMISHQVETKENVYMGLGWSVYEPVGEGEYALSHGGRDPGVNTMAFVLPRSGRMLLIFTNSDNGSQLYIDLVKFYLKSAGDSVVNFETRTKK